MLRKTSVRIYLLRSYVDITGCNAKPKGEVFCCCSPVLDAGLADVVGAVELVLVLRHVVVDGLVLQRVLI